MGRKILIISPIFPYPLNSGNRARIHQLLLNLQQLSQEVHFLYINTGNFNSEPIPEPIQGAWDYLYIAPYRAPQYSLFNKLFRKIGHLLKRESAFLYSIDDWYDHSLDSFLVQLASTIQFDAVIVEYVFFSRALECFGCDVLKIIDTHDVFSNRHRIFLRDNQFPHWRTTWFSTTPAAEAKGLNRADTIIAIQQQEQNFFSSLIDKPVVVVGHTVSLKAPVQHRFSGKTILYLGSENAINVQGINLFIRDILPKIKSHVPDIRLVLAGTICNAVESDQDLMKLGEIQELETAYGLADVVINPIFFGTGLKIKTVEALGYTRPLVTTSIGAAGLEQWANKAFLVADNPEEFSKKIIDIFSDIKLANRLSINAYSLIRQWNERNLKALAGALKLLDTAQFSEG